MPMNRIQFQSGVSLSQFLELHGAKEQCEAALEQTRWPDGFRCPRSGEQEHDLVYGRLPKRHQCQS
jgi:hypothetical protein